MEKTVSLWYNTNFDRYETMSPKKWFNCYYIPNSAKQIREVSPF